MSRVSERAHTKAKNRPKYQRLTKGAANRAAKTLRGRHRKHYATVAIFDFLPVPYRQFLPNFNDTTYAIQDTITQQELYNEGRKADLFYGVEDE